MQWHRVSDILIVKVYALFSKIQIQLDIPYFFLVKCGSSGESGQGGLP